MKKRLGIDVEGPAEAGDPDEEFVKDVRHRREWETLRSGPKLGVWHLRNDETETMLSVFRERNDEYRFHLATTGNANAAAARFHCYQEHEGDAGALSAAINWVETVPIFLSRHNNTKPNTEE